MPLFINWFKVDLSPVSVTLPTKDYASWEDSTAARESDALKPFDTYRGRTRPETISIVLLNGPPAPPDWEGRTYSASTHPNVAAEIVRRALGKHFQKAQLSTSRSQWELSATRPVCVMANEAIRLSSGVACNVYYPDAATGVGVAIRWVVATEFVKSLADGEVQAACNGLPVLLRYDPRRWQPDEKLMRYHDRYLGIVKRVVSRDVIEVLARDNHTYQIPADKLFLEAKPSTIREWENRVTGNQGGRSVWRKIQELNHVLTTSGRRNTSVLKDRLSSIRRFLSPHGNDLVVIDLPIYGGGQANVDLRPTPVPSEGG